MKNLRFLFIFFVLFSSSVHGNDIKIIELHKNKSLDQLVLEKENISEESQNIIEITQDEISTEDSSESVNSQVLSDDIENIENKNEIVTVSNSETLLDLDESIISNYFDRIFDIKSKTLHREFIKILSQPQITDQKLTGTNLYHIIKKLYDIGEIGKAYNLLKSVDIKNIPNLESINYFYFIELNYLFSTYQLSEVCELKSYLIEESFSLPSFLLEKTDIFCLTLENNFEEARLLNSLLLESEENIDQNFQALFNYMIINNQEKKSFKTLKEKKSKELVFLYSAMLRINELSLDEDFIEIDPLNLTIPVILSENTEMNIRIKAANRAFYDEVISIESLSALYQSVDFSSKDFNKPEETILRLGNNKEMIMAFYFQLANIQIFPDQRLNVILDYWKFAKDSALEEIAYSITKNITSTFEPSSENTEFGLEIALAHISNKNYSEASKWLNLFENTDLPNDKKEFVRFLISLNKTDELKIIIDYLSNNYEEIIKSNDQRKLETLEILMNFLNIKDTNFEGNYNSILDTRLMPSYFLIKEIKNKIESKNELSFFILSIISMNNQSWSELHPEHLNIILNAFNLYDQGSLIKSIILEMLNELEIF